jgi:ADP-heptose:LPS heptosyltransferase
VDILPNLALGSRVALVRLRSMGDCVLTTPAIRLLKQHRPDLEVGVVVEERFRDVYAGNPDIAALLPPTRSSLLQWQPKLCLNLHGGTRSAWITALSFARWRAGFGHYRFQHIYNVAIPRAQQVLGEERTVHTAEHVASAMFFLGVPRTEIPAACLYAKPDTRTSAYCVIHPQATAPEKIWPAERFLSLAGEIQERFGLEPLLDGRGSAPAGSDGFDCRSQPVCGE